MQVICCENVSVLRHARPPARPGRERGCQPCPCSLAAAPGRHPPLAIAPDVCVDAPHPEVAVAGLQERGPQPCSGQQAARIEEPSTLEAGSAAGMLPHSRGVRRVAGASDDVRGRGAEPSQRPRRQPLGSPRATPRNMLRWHMGITDHHRLRPLDPRTFHHALPDLDLHAVEVVILGQAQVLRCHGKNKSVSQLGGERAASMREWVRVWVGGRGCGGGLGGVPRNGVLVVGWLWWGGVGWGPRAAGSKASSGGSGLAA